MDKEPSLPAPQWDTSEAGPCSPKGDPWRDGAPVTHSPIHLLNACIWGVSPLPAPSYVLPRITSWINYLPPRAVSASVFKGPKEPCTLRRWSVYKLYNEFVNSHDPLQGTAIHQPVKSWKTSTKVNNMGFKKKKVEMLSWFVLERITERG